MEQITRPIQIVQSTSDRNSSAGITIPRNIYASTKKRTQVYVKVGAVRHKVMVMANDSQNNVLVSPYLFRKLGLYEGLTCQLQMTHGEIRLGPVIGVFVSPTYIIKLLRQNPRERTMGLIEGSHEAGNITYFFSKNDLRAQSAYVQATYYDQGSKLWKRKLMPLPDVLYDRGNESGAHSLTSKWPQKNNRSSQFVKLNARHHFSKWNVYKKLLKFPELQQYLPETRLFTKPEDLYSMLRKHTQVYVKKTGGNNGRGITLVERKRNGRFKCTTFTTQLMTATAHQFKDVLKMITSKYEPSRTILQQRIDVLQLDGRNVDFRATVQRDDQGRLGVTSISARLGEHGSPVTSTRTGAECYTFDRFLGEKLHLEPEQQLILIRKTNLFLESIYTAIEKIYGAFGELGIDFAIQNNGRLMFIEANAKPAKSAMLQSFDEPTIRRSFLAPMLYAQHISGFQATSKMKVSKL